VRYVLSSLFPSVADTNTTIRFRKISPQSSMIHLSPQKARISQQKKSSNAMETFAPLPFLNLHHRQHRLHLHDLNGITDVLVWVMPIQMYGKTKPLYDTLAEAVLDTEAPTMEWLHRQQFIHQIQSALPDLGKAQDLHRRLVSNRDHLVSLVLVEYKVELATFGFLLFPFFLETISRVFFQYDCLIP
jgi:hypothetical protein